MTISPRTRLTRLDLSDTRIRIAKVKLTKKIRRGHNVYQHMIRLYELESRFPYNAAVYLTQELKDTLELIRLPNKYKEDITEIQIFVGDGDFMAIWLTESNRPFEQTAIYHPLPYYQDENYNDRYPEYWKQSNPFYRTI